MEYPTIFHRICVMKTLKHLLIMALIVSAGLFTANAQTKTNKKTSKEADIKTKVDQQHYTFLADYVLPLRGGAHALTEVYYDLKVTKDTVKSFLPYFGRAYFDIPYNPSDGGIKFSSTKFDYTVKEKKKGGWEITINPRDVKNIERLILNISPDGYASLAVTCANRDFIAYDGSLK